MSEDILITGGYGRIGSRIAERLAQRYPHCVIVADRDEAKAVHLAERIGHGAAGRALDVANPVSVATALDGVRLVVNCADRRSPDFLRAVIARGARYTDTSANLAFWRLALDLETEARGAGACVLLGAGLAPGASNVMARAVAQRVGGADSVETHLLLGGALGPTALESLLQSMPHPFTLTEEGRERAARSFEAGREIDFPAPIGRRTAHRFALPDQVFYPRTLGAHTAASWLAFDSPWLPRLCSTLVRSGGSFLLRRPTLRRGMARLLLSLQAKAELPRPFVITVEARGEKGTARSILSGNDELHARAAAAALLASWLYEGRICRPGVWLPEQMIDAQRFFAELNHHGVSLVDQPARPAPSEEQRASL